jgi:hypothetical protein
MKEKSAAKLYLASLFAQSESYQDLFRQTDVDDDFTKTFKIFF